MSAMRVVEYINPPISGTSIWRKSFLGTFWDDFCGFRHPDPKLHDFLHPTILGVMELLAYPTLLYDSNWAVIGGWLAFKTYSRRTAWSEDRAIYNRFLIGNALVILISYFLSRCSYFF